MTCKMVVDVLILYGELSNEIKWLGNLDSNQD